jgi:hypothetical protein
VGEVARSDDDLGLGLGRSIGIGAGAAAFGGVLHCAWSGNLVA